MKKILLAMLVVSASVTAQAKVLISIAGQPSQVLEVTNIVITNGTLSIESQTEKYQIYNNDLEILGVSAKEMVDFISNHIDSKNRHLEISASSRKQYGVQNLSGVRLSFKQ